MRTRSCGEGEGGTGEVGDEKGRRWVSIRVGFDLRLTLSTLFSSIGRHLPCRRKRDEDEEAGVKKKTSWANARVPRRGWVAIQRIVS